MKIIKKSGDILGGILMIVSLILLIPLLLTNMGINSYIILSGSMEPVIRTGSMVLMDPDTEMWMREFVLLLFLNKMLLVTGKKLLKKALHPPDCILLNFVSESVFYGWNVRKYRSWQRAYFHYTGYCFANIY